jgi:hypothetical protein
LIYALAGKILNDFFSHYAFGTLEILEPLVKFHEMYVDFGMKKKNVLGFLFCTCIVTMCVELV